MKIFYLSVDGGNIWEELLSIWHLLFPLDEKCLTLKEKYFQEKSSVQILLSAGECDSSTFVEENKTSLLHFRQLKFPSPLFFFSTTKTYFFLSSISNSFSNLLFICHLLSHTWISFRRESRQPKYKDNFDFFAKR